MLDATLIFIGGLLGSSHCVGMCGGFVLTLGSVQKNVASNLFRQIIYASGRIFIYIVAGAASGYVGWRLGRMTITLVNLQAMLSLLAGTLLVMEGLWAAGVLPRWQWKGTKNCPGAAEFSALLRAQNISQVFVAGLLNGLLPCGLVYAYLALAASTSHLLYGMLVMGLFGLGTVPAMVLVGAGGSFLSGQSRRRVFALAAWCMVITGVITVVRGFGFLQIFPTEVTPRQLFCH